MKNDVLKLKNQYKKFNKKRQTNHIKVQDNYSQLCMEFFADKYNTLIMQNIAQQSCNVALQSESVFVSWLNKEWYV